MAMKSTGVVRQLDTLGRIVLPIELRRTMDIGVKDIAAQLHISESYVSKIFSRKLGCSLRSYLNALRVAQAKELLKHTDRKITDVLFACGFRNQGSFNQVFLNHTGLTPRAYRQKHR